MIHSKQTSKNKALFVGIGGLLLAALLIFFSPNRDGKLRNTLADLLKPGQQLTLIAAEKLQYTLNKQLFGKSGDEISEGHKQNSVAWPQERQQLQRTIRHLLLQQNQLQQRITDAELVPFRGEQGTPLVLPQLLEARIIGYQRDPSHSRGMMLDEGMLAGLPESAFVVDGTQTLLDQGTDARLDRGQPVYAARSVIGKIAQVGRWTSIVQLVTDPAYRGRARIVRQTKQGYLFGVETILEGTGSNLCRLKFIPSTEAVRVGDEVFTADRNGLLTMPMYYGRIVKAELKPTAPHWDVWVKPAIAEMNLQQVAVLRMQYQPERYLAN